MNFICSSSNSVCIGREITSFTNWFVTGSLLLCILHLNRLLWVQWNWIIDSTWNIFAASISLNRLGLHLQFVRYIDERRDNHIYHKYLGYDILMPFKCSWIFTWRILSCATILIKQGNLAFKTAAWILSNANSLLPHHDDNVHTFRDLRFRGFYALRHRHS
jgi:hypothetical protein